MPPNEFNDFLSDQNKEIFAERMRNGRVAENKLETVEIYGATYPCKTIQFEEIECKN